jgi:hypothetical protein
LFLCSISLRGRFARPDFWLVGRLLDYRNILHATVVVAGVTGHTASESDEARQSTS